MGGLGVGSLKCLSVTHSQSGPNISEVTALHGVAYSKCTG